MVYSLQWFTLGTFVTPVQILFQQVLLKKFGPYVNWTHVYFEIAGNWKTGEATKMFIRFNEHGNFACWLAGV